MTALLEYLDLVLLISSEPLVEVSYQQEGMATGCHALFSAAKVIIQYSSAVY